MIWVVDIFSIIESEKIEDDKHE